MQSILGNISLLSGNSNRPLAESIAQSIGIKLVDATITKFADKEIFVEIHENVRGKDAFIIQPTSFPANDHLMELLITIDALRRGSARRITAVVPYFGYARQDRKTGSRTPISAKLVANLITVAGADRVLTVDLHSGQIQGFFDIPLDNLQANKLFINDIKEKYGNDFTNLTLVSPDVGGVARARIVAKHLNTDLAIIDKRREKAGVSEVMNVIGSVEGQDCILIDDMADSAGTLCNAAVALKKNGAKSVSAYVTHGIFSNYAIDNINNSEISDFVSTNTIAPSGNIAKSAKIRYLDITHHLSEAIKRISEEKSLSDLFLS